MVIYWVHRSYLFFLLSFCQSPKGINELKLVGDREQLLQHVSDHLSFISRIYDLMRAMPYAYVRTEQIYLNDSSFLCCTYIYYPPGGYHHMGFHLDCDFWFLIVIDASYKSVYPLINYNTTWEQIADLIFIVISDFLTHTCCLIVHIMDVQVGCVNKSYITQL